MPRWLWFLPLGFLILIVAYNGIKLGIARANVTEGKVIDYYAQQYLEDHKRIIGTEAALTDCVAIPSDTPPVWIEVRCSPADGSASFLYGVRRDGGLSYAARDQAAPET